MLLSYKDKLVFFYDLFAYLMQTVLISFAGLNVEQDLTDVDVKHHSLIKIIYFFILIEKENFNYLVSQNK